MIKIDLITGFLGSGKTTFLKKYVKYLLSKGLRIGIVENDFGAINVDMLLLQDLLGENCDIEMVVGSDDRETYQRRLKAKLISLGMRGFDRVLIEPSGIFDVEEFYDVLQEDPLYRWYEIGNVIAVVDWKLEDDLSEKAKYLLATQIASAGKILYSKIEDGDSDSIIPSDPMAVPETRLYEKLCYLQNILQQFGSNIAIRESDVLAKNWDMLKPEDYEELLHCGYRTQSLRKPWFKEKEIFTSIYFLDYECPLEKLKDKAEVLFRTSEFGKILRIKGFLQEKGDWLSFNATAKDTQITKAQNGQKVVIVIGEELKRSAIEDFMKV